MRTLGVLVLALATAGTAFLGSDAVDVAPQLAPLSEPRLATTAEPRSVPSTELPEFEAVLVAEGLDRPTFAVPVPDGALLVTEKSGVVRLVRDGEVAPEPFLDLDHEIPDRRPERGLLAIALHPDFGSNGRFYVHFTDQRGDSRLVEYRRSAEEPDTADPRSARLVLRVEQPGEFHNGGMIQFGPDGYLFVAMGDGGFGEPSRYARRTGDLLGGILRIDVDADKPYAVPADNPFVGGPGADEVWMTGMRNPWRFFIDGPTRSIVVGDVGQFVWEEIQVLSLDDAGADLGWPVLEGRACYEADQCDSDGLVLPDIVYPHSLGCAMIAGPIYRGVRAPDLVGMVVYADYCSGRVSAYANVDGHPRRHVPLIESGTYGPILSLAIDADGEVLLLTEKGEIRRLQPIGQSDESD